jgi:hypothetical protein
MAKDKLIKKEEDLKNTSINAMTGEAFTIPADDPEWLKARETDKDGKAVIVTPSGKRLEIHRRGMTADELGAIMLTPNLTSEERNNAVTQYLVCENQDNAMFTAELFQSRGLYTKEARHFYSQMRQDFENFAGMFETWLRSRAKSIAKGLGLSDERMVELMKESVKTKKEVEFFEDPAENTLLCFAIGCLDEAEMLKAGVDKLTTERERLKGGGTFVSKNGKLYNLHDSNIREVVEKEFLEENPDAAKKVEKQKRANN